MSYEEVIVDRWIFRAPSGRDVRVALVEGPPGLYVLAAWDPDECAYAVRAHHAAAHARILELEALERGCWDGMKSGDLSSALLWEDLQPLLLAHRKWLWGWINGVQVT